MLNMNKDIEARSKRNHVIIMVVILFLVIVTNVGCYLLSHKPVARPVAAAPVAAAKAVDPDLSKKYAAIFRQLRVTKVCVANGSESIFLVFFPKDIKEWNGWWELNDLEFLTNQRNDTMYLKDIPGSKYDRVWPDVTGTPCATAEQYPDK